MMIMMYCFCGIVDQWKDLVFIPSGDHCQRFSPSQIFATLRLWLEPALKHCQRFSPSQIFDTLRPRLEPALKQNWSFAEWSCTLVIQRYTCIFYSTLFMFPGEMPSSFYIVTFFSISAETFCILYYLLPYKRTFSYQMHSHLKQNELSILLYLLFEE